VLEQTCAGQGCDADRSGSGAGEGAGNGASGSAGGENVVDDQDVALGDGARIGHGEGAADVAAALVRAESGLAVSGANADDGVGRESETPAGMGVMERPNGGFGEQTRLVEPALSMLGAVQRNGDYREVQRGVCSQLRDGLGEETAERARGRRKPLIFQRMDGVAHAVFVGAVGYGADEAGRGETADAADGGGIQVWTLGRLVVGMEGVGALGADRAAEDRNFGPASFTDGNGRKARQRGAA
jgi:hypothetical protein